jgi:hypothetical protein
VERLIFPFKSIILKNINSANVKYLNMGKFKQNKKKNRLKPTGMISVQEAEEREADQGSSSLDEKTLPILEKVFANLVY